MDRVKNRMIKLDSEFHASNNNYTYQRLPTKFLKNVITSRHLIYTKGYVTPFQTAGNCGSLGLIKRNSTCNAIRRLTAVKGQILFDNTMNFTILRVIVPVFTKKVIIPTLPVKIHDRTIYSSYESMFLSILLIFFSSIKIEVHSI